MKIVTTQNKFLFPSSGTNKHQTNNKQHLLGSIKAFNWGSLVKIDTIQNKFFSPYQVLKNIRATFGSALQQSATTSPSSQSDPSTPEVPQLTWRCSWWPGPRPAPGTASWCAGSTWRPEWPAGRMWSPRGRRHSACAATWSPRTCAWSCAPACCPSKAPPATGKHSRCEAHCWGKSRCSCPNSGHCWR